MISREQVAEILSHKNQLSYTIQSFQHFSERYQTLANIISGQQVEQNQQSPRLSKNERFVAVFGDEPNCNPWLCAEGQKLALLLFGKVNAPYIARVWERFKSLPYQSNFNRRSFRCPHSHLYLANALSALSQIHKVCAKGFVDCSMQEQMRLSSHFDHYALSHLFAAAFENGDENQQLTELVVDILHGEDEIGAVSRSIIKGLLLTNNQANWQLVEGLLLAAQRQEGLRQSILECLDETHVDALRYFIGVILDNDLMRFSSVVRAVDVWFGFGWQGPKQATIKRVLECAAKFIDQIKSCHSPLTADSIPASLLQAVQGKDHLVSYTALWALALTDVNLANQVAFNIVFDAADVCDKAAPHISFSKNQKLLALYFISETELSCDDLPPYMVKSWGTDIELDYWMLRSSPDFKWQNDFFEKVKQSADSLPTKGKQFGSQVFEWLTYQIKADDFYQALIKNADVQQYQILAAELTKIPSESRQLYIQKVFPRHYSYGLFVNFYTPNSQEIPTLELAKDDWQRRLIHQAICDRNESVMATGINCLNHMMLNQDDLAILVDLLARKSEDLRTHIIELLVRQPKEQLKVCTNTLLTATKELQRLAGLEVLAWLNEQGSAGNYVSKQVELYQQRSTFSKNEEVLLAKFNNEQEPLKLLTFANGFGAIDYNNLRPLHIPEKNIERRFSLFNLFRDTPTEYIKTLVNEQKLATQVNKLLTLFADNRHFEYQYETYQGAIETTLLADSLQNLKIISKDADAITRLTNLPLVEVWQQWYQQSELNDFELFYAHCFLACYQQPFENLGEIQDFIQSYYPKFSAINIGEARSYHSVNLKAATVVKAFMDVHCEPILLAEFKLSIFEDMLARYPNSLKTKNLSNISYFDSKRIWVDVISESEFAFVGSFINPIIQNRPELLQRFYDLHFYVFAQKVGFPNSIDNMQVLTQQKYAGSQINNFDFTVTLFNHGLLPTENLLFEGLYNRQLFNMLDGGSAPKRRAQAGSLKVPVNGMQRLKTNLLKLELERGDLPSEASDYINHLVKIEGVHYLFEVLLRLGKENLERGYGYASHDKRSTFSRIIKLCQAKEGQTFQMFAEQAQLANISKSRLMDVACYAPQWADWIGQFLKIKDLPAAVWWFHAHATDYMTAEKETQIARYSNINRRDFQNGAIDIDWFNRVYNNLGRANWKLLHDSAKYTSDGNGHRQVKLYSSVMLGEVKITETFKKVEEKRDKDYLRSLGLIPLSKTVPDKDLLKRYNFIQQFLKDSKQFGAQRQESEKLACSIALENLARNAGYDDSTRFEWAMETQATDNIMQNATVTFDDVSISLQIDRDGKPQIAVQKGDKTQKSIPAKYKKDKQVLALKESKNYLTKQYARTRVSLENAMLNEAVFSLYEIQKITCHPIVSAILSKLVLFNSTNHTFGFCMNGELVDSEGKRQVIRADDKILIAHTFHLYVHQQWSEYQSYLFTQQLQQPFKQVFRELYVISADEKERCYRSERYQGQQIQPAKTVSLLRARGWTASYEDGLQKVFHKLGFMVTIYAQADWFSPADIEAPTLEYVCFHALSDYKEISLLDVPAVIFSEVMRDLDLVVSVAHVGGVDPEASHSTMQMRALLAIESARLFKLSNVQVQDRHIVIKGKLGEYSIHLGSAKVKKQGLDINIIAVQSQHRGRVFLPFIDDDPKSAELISKMKLLAEDYKIKDPTVLAQLNK